MFWEDCECKNLHPPTPLGVTTTNNGMLKVDQGGWYGCLQPSGRRPYPPPKPQARLILTSKFGFSRKSGAEANFHLTGKFILPETSIANRIVVLTIQQENIINSTALNPNPESPFTLGPTLIPAEVPVIPGTAPSTLILCPALRASNPPRPGTPTPALLVPDQSAPATLPIPPPVPNSVKFVLRIK